MTRQIFRDGATATWWKWTIFTLDMSWGDTSLPLVHGKLFSWLAPLIPPALTSDWLVLTESLCRSGFAAPKFLVGEPEDSELVRSLNIDSGACDACVCSNDMTAARLLQTAQTLGHQVPRDFRLAGFDDVGFATLLSVPLTTIRQPCRAIGMACVDTLLGRLAHPELPARAILLRGELVVRDSTATETKN